MQLYSPLIAIITSKIITVCGITSITYTGFMDDLQSFVNVFIISYGYFHIFVYISNKYVVLVHVCGPSNSVFLAEIQSRYTIPEKREKLSGFWQL